MPNTYDLISSTTLTNAVSAFTVSIPSNYTDIQIRASLRSTRSGYAIGNLHLNINGVTSSSYGRITIYDEGGAIGGERQPVGNSSSAQIGGIAAQNLSSSYFTNVLVNLQNYANSLKKTMDTVTSIQAQGASTRYIWRNAMVFDSTNVISNISFVDTTATVDIGSTISIYGIKKA